MHDVGEIHDYELERIFNTWSEGDLKSILRDIKLKVLVNELTFKIDKTKFKDMPLSIIREMYPNAIITGSSALKAFGLLNRPIKDFDIIVDEKPDIQLYDIETGTDTNRIGYADFSIEPRGFLGISLLFKQLFNKEKIVNVDFFLNDDKTNFQEVEYEGFTYKFHDPLQILDKKCSMVFKDMDSSYMLKALEKHRMDIAYFEHKTKSYGK